jgi:uncharacterized metal-binding protein
MSTGRVHALATVVAAGASGPLLFSLGHFPLGGAASFVAGCMLGLVITPDLDIRHGTHAEEVVRSTVGGFFAGLWFALWWPYAHIIPRHRHPLSHFPLLGTAGRVLYLCLLLGLVWFGLGFLVPLPPLYAPPAESGLWWALAGLCLVDTLHAMMDVL